MKIVLQHKMTRLYLTTGDKWTTHPDEARDFGTSLKALDFVRRLNMDEADIVLKFADSKYDIVLRTPSFRPGHERSQEHL